jgi:hypothetical protein
LLLFLQLLKTPSGDNEILLSQNQPTAPCGLLTTSIAVSSRLLFQVSFLHYFLSAGEIPL